MLRDLYSQQAYFCGSQSKRVRDSRSSFSSVPAIPTPQELEADPLAGSSEATVKKIISSLAERINKARADGNFTAEGGVISEFFDGEKEKKLYLPIVNGYLEKFGWEGKIGEKHFRSGGEGYGEWEANFYDLIITPKPD